MQALKQTILENDLPDGFMEGCRRKDARSQELLYRYCYPLLINICLRYAGDMDGAGTIFNNAMIRVFKYIDTYEHENKLLAWIKRIVVNCCIDYVKARNKFRLQEITEEQEQIFLATDVFDRISFMQIQEIMSTLPPATASVFNLFIYEGLSHREIAAALDISEGTSKWHVSEGRRLLKSALKNLNTL